MNAEITAISGEERLARIRLNAFGCLRSDWLRRLLDFYGCAKDVLERTPEEISSDGGVSAATARRLIEESSRLDPEKELKRVSQFGGSVILPEDGCFPGLLRDIPDAPLVIYVRGKMEPSACPAAIVGTRRPTVYGRRMAARLSADLAKAGVAVVSGLARGIDTVAHDAVVRAGGVTWAVLGTGLARCYPSENKRLAEKIVESGGALVSEFPLDTGPLPMHFPRRNRIISGLSYATVVVEGGEKSGALITAKAALEQGREVLAVPGQADSEASRGPNRLIRDGAGLAETAVDVTNVFPTSALFGIKIDSPASSRAADSAKLGPELSAVLECIGPGELCADEIVDRLGWTVPRVAGALFELETGNLVISSGGKYSKK